MIRYLIDANCAIYATSGEFEGMGEKNTACEPGEIAFSTLSYAEVAQGTSV